VRNSDLSLGKRTGPGRWAGTQKGWSVRLAGGTKGRCAENFWSPQTKNDGKGSELQGTASGKKCKEGSAANGTQNGKTADGRGGKQREGREQKAGHSEDSGTTQSIVGKRENFNRRKSSEGVDSLE